jgi:hypothetical protein
MTPEEAHATITTVTGGRSRAVEGPTQPVCVRLSPEEITLLEAAAARRGMNRSDMLRFLVAWFIDDGDTGQPPADVLPGHVGEDGRVEPKQSSDSVGNGAWLRKGPVDAGVAAAEPVDDVRVVEPLDGGGGDDGTWD